MIVSEKDSIGKKVKWYIVCVAGSIAILFLVGAALPFLIMIYCNRIVGGILFLPCFWVATKLCFMLENHIGIGASLQNPNRHNLVPVFSEVCSIPWMHHKKREKKK